MKLFMSKTFFRGVLIFNAAMILIPVLFLVNSSLRETNDFARTPLKFATDPAWGNFASVWQDGNFAVYLKNSVIVTGGSLILILICALGAGFVLGRYEFRGHSLIMAFVLSGMLIPAKLMILPLFIQLKWMHLLDSHLGLILVYAAGALPAAIFIMSGFFRTLPADLDNAARIDGASELLKSGLVEIIVMEVSPNFGDVSYLKGLSQLLGESYHWFTLDETGTFKRKPCLRRISLKRSLSRTEQWNLVLVRDDVLKEYITRNHRVFSRSESSFKL